MPDFEQDKAAYVRAVHDKGLQVDLKTMSRRRMLAVIGGAGGFAAIGGGIVLSAGDAAAETLAEVESETAGPCPADGSNGPDGGRGYAAVRGRRPLRLAERRAPLEHTVRVRQRHRHRHGVGPGHHIGRRDGHCHHIGHCHHSAAGRSASGPPAAAAEEAPPLVVALVVVTRSCSRSRLP